MSHSKLFLKADSSSDTSNSMTKHVVDKCQSFIDEYKRSLEEQSPEKLIELSDLDLVFILNTIVLGYAKMEWLFLAKR